MNRIFRARHALALAGALAVAAVPALPAMAASDASFAITLTPSATEIRAGEKVDVEIAYTCTGAGSCDHVVIDLPRPDGLPSGVWSSTWANPVVSASADVAASAIGYDGDVRLTMKDAVAAGSSGTIGITYSTYTTYTPNGTPLVVDATVTGGNVPAVTASATVNQTAVPDAVAASLYAPYPVYLDRDQTHTISLYSSGTDVVGTEGMKTATVELVLPAGAVFVSADQEPTSISPDGTTIRWDDLVGPSTYDPVRSRSVQYVVRFPSGSFTPGQSTGASATVTGTTLSGAAFTRVTPSTSFTLREFLAKFEPYLQFFNGGNQVAQASGFDNVYARGAEAGVYWYLNNYNSTVPATSYTASVDLPAEFTATRMNPPSTDTGVLVVHWRTESGATGQFTTADYAAGDDEWNRPLAPTFEELGVPAGDRVVHLDIDGTTIPGPGGGNLPTVMGAFDAPNGTRVPLTTSVVFHADDFADITRTATTGVIVVDPLPAAQVSLSTDSTAAARPGETIDWTAYVSNDIAGMSDLQPVVYFPIPKGTKPADVPVTMGSAWQQAPIGFGTPTTRVVHNEVLDQDVLVVSWPEDARLGAWGYLPLTIHTVVTSAPAGDLPAVVYAGDGRGPVAEFPYMQGTTKPPFASGAVNPWDARVRDDLDLDGDGSTGGMLARATANSHTGSGAGLRSQLEVRGSLDSDFVTVPQVGATESGKTITYRLPIQNTGNVTLSDTVIYDVLPHVGDTGVSGAAAGQSRGSQFTPRLASEVTAPEGFTVEYSTSTNPCRPEVFPGQGACDDDWTATPGDFAQVRALKFVQAEGGALDGGSATEAVWSMSVAQDTPVGSRAVNSAAFAATRGDNGALLTAEPAFTAVEVAQADLGVAITGGTWTAGERTPLAVEVSNAGPSAAPAHVEITLPEGLAASGSATVARDGESGTWSCTVIDTLVTCDAVGLVPTGATQVLPLTVQPEESLIGSTVTVTAEVSGRYPDPVAANNTASATFDIVAPVDPTEPPVEPTPDPTDPAVDPTPTPTDPAVDPTPTPTDPAVDPTPVDPSAPASAAPTGDLPVISPSPSPTSAPGGRQLPWTGASVVGVAAVAAGLIAAGVLVLRRRRAED